MGRSIPTSAKTKLQGGAWGSGTQGHLYAPNEMNGKGANFRNGHGAYLVNIYIYLI
jgi:hypothetical protein